MFINNFFKYFFKKPSLKFALSLFEISVVLLIIGILFVGISTGIDLYSEYKLLVARNLTRNSIVGRLHNVRLWYENSLDESFVKNENKDGNPITIWHDIKINQNVNYKYHAYGATKRSSGELVKFYHDPNYDPDSSGVDGISNMVNVSGPKYISNGINNLPTLNFKNNLNELTSQFLAIDPNITFDDDFDIFMVVEFKNLDPSKRTFLMDRICLNSSGAFA